MPPRIRSGEARGIRILKGDEAVERTWTPGNLHVGGTALTWTPLDGYKGMPRDLATATDIRETPLLASRNPNRATWRLIMRIGQQQVELLIFGALLPFARAGLQQVAATDGSDN